MRSTSIFASWPSEKTSALTFQRPSVSGARLLSKSRSCWRSAPALFRSGVSIYTAFGITSSRSEPSPFVTGAAGEGGGGEGAVDAQAQLSARSNKGLRESLRLGHAASRGDREPP